jgi:hypothetical protein
MGKQVTLQFYPGPTNGETGNIPRLFKTNPWGNRYHSMPIQYQHMGGGGGGEQVTLTVIPMDKEVTNKGDSGEQVRVNTLLVPN